MIRFIIKNLSGFPTATDINSTRCHARMFRSLSPPFSYNCTETDVTNYDQNFSRRPHSIPRRRGLSTTALCSKWLTNFDRKSVCITPGIDPTKYISTKSEAKGPVSSSEGKLTEEKDDKKDTEPDSAASKDKSQPRSYGTDTARPLSNVDLYKIMNDVQIEDSKKYPRQRNLKPLVPFKSNISAPLEKPELSTKFCQEEVTSISKENVISQHKVEKNITECTKEKLVKNTLNINRDIPRIMSVDSLLTLFRTKNAKTKATSVLLTSSSERVVLKKLEPETNFNSKSRSNENAIPVDSMMSLYIKKDYKTTLLQKILRKTDSEKKLTNKNVSFQKTNISNFLGSTVDIYTKEETNSKSEIEDNTTVLPKNNLNIIHTSKSEELPLTKTNYNIDTNVNPSVSPSNTKSNHKQPHNKEIHDNSSEIKADQCNLDKVTIKQEVNQLLFEKNTKCDRKHEEVFYGKKKKEHKDSVPQYLKVSEEQNKQVLSSVSAEINEDFIKQSPDNNCFTESLTSNITDERQLESEKCQKLDLQPKNSTSQSEDLSVKEEFYIRASEDKSDMLFRYAQDDHENNFDFYETSASKEIPTLLAKIVPMNDNTCLPPLAVIDACEANDNSESTQQTPLDHRLQGLLDKRSMKKKFIPKHSTATSDQVSVWERMLFSRPLSTLPAKQIIQNLQKDDIKYDTNMPYSFECGKVETTAKSLLHRLERLEAKINKPDTDKDSQSRSKKFNEAGYEDTWIEIKKPNKKRNFFNKIKIQPEYTEDITKVSDRLRLIENYANKNQNIPSTSITSILKNSPSRLSDTISARSITAAKKVRFSDTVDVSPDTNLQSDTTVSMPIPKKNVWKSNAKNIKQKSDKEELIEVWNAVTRDNNQKQDEFLERAILSFCTPIKENCQKAKINQESINEYITTNTWTPYNRTEEEYKKSIENLLKRWEHLDNAKPSKSNKKTLQKTIDRNVETVQNKNVRNNLKQEQYINTTKESQLHLKKVLPQTCIGLTEKYPATFAPKTVQCDNTSSKNIKTDSNTSITLPVHDVIVSPKQLSADNSGATKNMQRKVSRCHDDLAIINKSIKIVPNELSFPMEPVKKVSTRKYLKQVSTNGKAIGDQNCTNGFETDEQFIRGAYQARSKSKRQKIPKTNCKKCDISEKITVDNVQSSKSLKIKQKYFGDWKNLDKTNNRFFSCVNLNKPNNDFKKKQFYSQSSHQTKKYSDYSDKCNRSYTNFILACTKATQREQKKHTNFSTNIERKPKQIKSCFSTSPPINKRKDKKSTMQPLYPFLPEVDNFCYQGLGFVPKDFLKQNFRSKSYKSAASHDDDDDHHEKQKKKSRKKEIYFQLDESDKEVFFPSIKNNTHKRIESAPKQYLKHDNLEELSVWQKIWNYFKTSIEDKKKRIAREKARKGAKTAGLSLYQKQYKQKSSDVLPKVITHKPKQKDSQENSHLTKQSYSKFTFSRHLNKPSEQRRSYSTETYVAKELPKIKTYTPKQKVQEPTKYGMGLKTVLFTTGNKVIVGQNRDFSIATAKREHRRNLNEKKNFSSSASVRSSTKNNKVVRNKNQKQSHDKVSNNISADNIENDLVSYDDDKDFETATEQSEYATDDVLLNKVGSACTNKKIGSISKRCFSNNISKEAHLKNLAEINRTLEEKDRQRMTEKILKSIIEANTKYQCDRNFTANEIGINARKISLAEVMFGEPMDERGKYQQAKRLDSFLDAFSREVVSDVNHEDLEKIKTNRLINELNKLIVEDDEDEDAN